MRLFPLLAIVAFAAASPLQAAPKASKADAEACAAYQHRVDDALAAHPSARKLEHAKAERDAGGTACGAGQYDAGIKHYKIALRDLGVKAVKQQ